MENNELYHYGIKDMKWGVRRYQNEDGSLTPLGREHYGYGIKTRFKNAINTIKTKHQAKVDLKKKAKKKKEAAKRLEAARKAKAEKKAFDEAKKKAYETGSAEEVLKYKDHLTTEEKQKAAQRLQTEANLTRMARDNAQYKAEEAARNSKWNKLMGVTAKIGQASAGINNVVAGYNSAAKIINSFSDSPIPIIGEKKESKNTISPEAVRYTNEMVKQFRDMSTEELSKVNMTYFQAQAMSLDKIEKMSRGVKP